MTSPADTPLTTLERTKKLKERALELGFDAFGVALAQTADPEHRLRAWLDRGYHGNLSWMETTYERRVDITKSLPGARSVVAVSASYYRGEIAPNAKLKIARYAQGKDYHRWFRRKVRKLRKYLIQLAPGCQVYPTVDTSPVLEREWAARAGIAWIGKSTMAIHPQLGTYTYLGTLITDCELEPNDPLPNRCGTCTACLSACPTQAFVEPGVLDARKCIAYWTLEQHGELPDDLPPFHGWTAGCDICQEVCPWNKFAKTSTDPHTDPHPHLLSPDIDTFTLPDANESLCDALRATTLQRTGAETIRRNARRNLHMKKI
ncbi:MAG: tRNA epoxyqueuosine(34) reductase QueG [Myxococcales bacterium]|nr:tRNA epoxyqueuosine(34) reductase QueG [Myxococcales bacterium]